ncbi:hypothetical protein Hanom_Chr07g00588741 [Helianthus anomalus]
MLDGTSLILVDVRSSLLNDSIWPKSSGNLETLQPSRMRVLRCFNLQMLSGRCLIFESVKFSSSKHSN